MSILTNPWQLISLLLGLFAIGLVIACRYMNRERDSRGRARQATWRPTVTLDRLHAEIDEACSMLRQAQLILAVQS